MIAIIDYGVGNLRSVQKAFEKVGADARVTQDPADIKKADKVVLPGVGAMGPAMEKLESLGLVSVIKEVIRSGKPFLGICLGMQLLFEKGEESGGAPGLGILKGTVKKLFSKKIPHMGWNQIKLDQKYCALFKGIKDSSNFYFCHSYYAAPGDGAVTAATTDYDGKFACAVAKEKLFGVQFHPEKSQTLGLAVLKNFTELA